MHTVLTKEQRHKIYKEALAIYKSYSHSINTSGMCRALAYALYMYLDLMKSPIPPFDYLLDIFPEFKAIKPRYIETCKHYWWDITDHEGRIKQFEHLIDITK